MGDPFKHVRSGDALRIPAQTFNTMVDAAREYAARRADVQPGSRTRLSQSGVVKVKNTSSADCPRFGPLILGDPIILPADNLGAFQAEPAFKAVTPSGLTGPIAWRLAIAQEPIKAGSIGHAVVQGLTPAQITIDAAAPLADYARVEPNDMAALRTAYAGPARILWRESGTTGTKWSVIVVNADPGRPLRIKLANAFNVDRAATAYAIDYAGSPVGQPITVYDPYSLWYGGAGKRGYAVFFPDIGRFEVIQLEC